MKVDDIEIHAGTPSFAYEPVRRLEARCEAATNFSPAPTMNEVNQKLREMALSVGANAVVEVAYTSGVSMTSWRSMRGTGLAVRRASDEVACPVCAETIKRAAQRCRFCGADTSAAAAQATPKPASPTAARRVAEMEPLRSNNNPQWWVAIAAAVLLIWMFASLA